MKTSFLLMLSLLSTGAWADVPVQTFKADLGSRLSAMGKAMHEMLTADTSFAVSSLHTIMGSRTYKVCTDKSRDNTRNDRKKMEQIEACQSVGEMTKRLAGEMSSRDQVRNARIDLTGKEKALLQYIHAQTLMPRVELGMEVHKNTTAEYNRHNKVLNQMASDETANTKSACYSLPLSRSINCAMNRTVDLLANKVPTLMVRHRGQMDRTVNEALNRVALYQDPAGLALTDEASVDEVSVDEVSDETEVFSSMALLEAVLPELE